MKDSLLFVHLVIKTLHLEITRCHVIDCVKELPHVQQDYFSSFNQSDHCFLALSMPLPSSLLKLPIFLHSFRVSCRRVNNDTHLPYLVVRDVSIFHSFLLWLRYESLFRPRRFVNENQRHVPAMNLHKKKEKKSIKISQAYKAQYHKNKTKVGEGV